MSIFQQWGNPPPSEYHSSSEGILPSTSNEWMGEVIQFLLFNHNHVWPPLVHTATNVFNQVLTGNQRNHYSNNSRYRNCISLLYGSSITWIKWLENGKTMFLGEKFLFTRCKSTHLCSHGPKQPTFPVCIYPAVVQLFNLEEQCNSENTWSGKFTLSILCAIGFICVQQCWGQRSAQL